LSRHSSVAVVDVDEAVVRAAAKEIAANDGKAKGFLADLGEDANSACSVRSGHCDGSPGSLSRSPPGCQSRAPAAIPAQRGGRVTSVHAGESQPIEKRTERH
jgi:hypothetical protein